MTRPVDGSDEVAAPAPSPWRAAIALFVCLLVLYLGNGRTLKFRDAGDNLPARLIPFALLSHGTVTLEPFRATFHAHGGYGWYVQERRGTLVSYYPIGMALLALPVYVPWFGVLLATGRATPEGMFLASPYAEKLTASLLTALAVVLVWLVLRGRTGARRAMLTAVALGCCTLCWAVASQELWQMTGGAVLLPALLLLDEHRPPRASAFPAGLLAGLWFVVRPMAVLFGAAYACGLIAATEGSLAQRARVLLRFLAGAALLVVPDLLYTRYFYGGWLAGYGSATSLFSNPWVIVEGGNGLLLSANKGLFVLMPLTLVGVAGAWKVVQRPREEPVLAALVVAAFAYFLLHAATQTWAGGWCFGPRYLIETLPLLAVTSVFALPRPSAATKALLLVAAIWSFLVQLSGAWFYPASSWNARMGNDLESAAWSWRHFEPWEDFVSWRSQHRR